jgi:hypothetical protein
MKLGELMQELERLEMHQAVYDELVSYLGKVLDDEDLSIPVATGDGVVPAKYVEEVISALEAKSSGLGEALAEAEDAEVGDVELNLGGG